MKSKIYKLEELATQIEIEKKKSQKIIMCHGCFDFLHLGHIKHFEEAKRFGNILIVTVTADKFVKNPHEIVKPGDIVSVRVSAIDLPRNRISLSMKQKVNQPENVNNQSPKFSGSHMEKNKLESNRKSNRGVQQQLKEPTQDGNALAQALAKARLNQK